MQMLVMMMLLLHMVMVMMMMMLYPMFISFNDRIAWFVV
jgi:hypothetical protein